MRFSVLGACSLWLCLLFGAQPVSALTTISVNVPDRSSLLTLEGYASPGAFITILESNTVIGTATADSNSFFTKTFTGLVAGVKNIGLYASDTSSRLTATTNVAITVPFDTHVTVTDFFLSPSFQVNKSPMKRPDRQVYEGLTRNNSTVKVILDGGSAVSETTANANGSWTLTASEVYHLGTRSVSTIGQDGVGNQSTQSDSQSFQVELSADLNVEGRVNLTDFSILMFNFDSNNPPNWAADINDDATVDLVDFSIMMFYWNGDDI